MREKLSLTLAKETLGSRFEDAAKHTKTGEKIFTYGVGDQILMGGKGFGQWSDSINAYEYANICKLWAYKKGYTLLTYYMEDVDGWHCDLISKKDWKYKDLMGKGIVFGVGRKKEYEAIFSACNEILRIKKE